MNQIIPHPIIWSIFFSLTRYNYFGHLSNDTPLILETIPKAQETKVSILQTRCATVQPSPPYDDVQAAFFIIRLMIRVSFLTLTIGDINHLIRRIFHTELFFGLSKGQDTLQYCAFDQMVVCPGLWYRSPPSSQEANWKHGQGFHSRTAKRATGISGLSYSAPCAVQLPACQKVPGPQ